MHLNRLIPLHKSHSRHWPYAYETSMKLQAKFYLDVFPPQRKRDKLLPPNLTCTVHGILYGGL